MAQRGRLLAVAKLSSVVFLVLFFTAGLAELGLRAVDPLGIAYFFEAPKYFASMQLNDTYGYIHTPGYKQKLEGVDVSINSHGLRGPEFNTIKSQGTTRILILGDSVVFGWGAPQNDIFALQLQRLFDRQRTDIEVIPAGVGSWNTRTEYEYLASTAIGFQPDVLVLFIVANDLKPKRGGHTEVSKERLFAGKKPVPAKNISRDIWRWAVRYSYLLKHIQYLVTIKKAREEQLQTTAESPEWEDVRLALDGMIKLCRDKGIEFIPYLYGSAAHVETHSVLSLYKKHLESRGVKVFTLPDALFEQKHRNSIIDRHANASGHAIIARELHQRLAPILTRNSVGK